MPVMLWAVVLSVLRVKAGSFMSKLIKAAAKNPVTISITNQMVSLNALNTRKPISGCFDNFLLLVTPRLGGVSEGLRLSFFFIHLHQY